MPHTDPPPCVAGAEIDQGLEQSDTMLTMFAESFRRLRHRVGHDDACFALTALLADYDPAEVKLMLLCAITRLADAEDDSR